MEAAGIFNADAVIKMLVELGCQILKDKQQWRASGQDKGFDGAASGLVGIRQPDVSTRLRPLSLAL
jgi:hypothetical protein